MASHDPNQMFDLISSICECLKSAIKDAEKLSEVSSSFAGEIERVISEQLSNYFIPAVSKLIDDTDTAGSMKGLSIFLDSCPLSITRKESVADTIEPVVPANAQLTMPTGEQAISSEPSTVEEIPDKASFQNPEGVPEATESNNLVEEPAQEENPSFNQPAAEEAPVMEKKESCGHKLHESIKIYQVVRKANSGSSLGDIANLKGLVVAEFNEKEKAELKVEELNNTVTPEEKKLLGTEYSIEEKEVETQEA